VLLPDSNDREWGGCTRYSNSFLMQVNFIEA
jgi:hypothetical protein